MVVFQTKITTTGVLYIPKEIRESFSRNLKIIPSAKAALFFPADAKLEDVVQSAEIIVEELKLRIKFLLVE